MFLFGLIYDTRFDSSTHQTTSTIQNCFGWKKGEFKWFMAKNNNARVIKNNLWRRRIGFYIFFDNNLLIFLRVAKGIKNHKFMCSIGFLSFSPGRRDCLMSEDLFLFPCRVYVVCLIVTHTLKGNHKIRGCFAWNRRRITSPARNYNLIDHKRLRGNFNVSLCNSWLALAVIIRNEFVPLALWCLIYDWLLKRQQSFMFVSIFDGFARKCIKMSHKLSDFTGNCTLEVGNDISLSWTSSIGRTREWDFLMQ